MHTSYHKQRQETTFPFANEEKKAHSIGNWKAQGHLGALYLSFFLMILCHIC
jgi:hypothetical protein